MKNILICMALTLLNISCVSAKDDSEAFAEFDEADQLACQKWLLDEQTLGVYDLFQSGVTPLSFVAKVRRRNNSIQFHHRPIINSEMEIEKTKELFLPSEAHILGSVSSSAYENLLMLNPERNYAMELRSQPDNKIVFADNVNRDGIYNEQIIMRGDHGFWLVYSLDGEKPKTKVEYYEMKRMGSTFELSKSSAKEIKNVPEKALFVEHSGLLVGMYVEENQDKSWIEYQIIDHRGEMSPRVDLNVPVSTKVDKWSAISDGQSLFLAIIDGDSFLRQSNLRVAAAILRGKVMKISWSKTKSLMSYHVSTPLWIKGNDSISLLIPKWLDGKSTLAKYSVSADKVSGTGHIGQFPKAARIMPTRSNGKSGQFVIVRTRDQIGWSYDVCKLEL